MSEVLLTIGALKKGIVASGKQHPPQGPSEYISMQSPQKATHETGSERKPAVPSISLPKGGGAIRGIGEKFAAQPATGTGAMSVPIALTPGRSGFGPKLSLSYDSGSGNGPFGVGWSLSLPAITRKTDKGLPEYRDLEESDVYILSGAEDLVPMLDSTGARFEDKTTVPGFVIHRYRPRIEGLFARIERWTKVATGAIHWRSITSDNVTAIYGKDNNSRIFDPAEQPTPNPTRVFSWLICESYDDKGNAIVYQFAEENDDSVDHRQPNERNRVRTANRYVKRIKYGNRVSRLVQPDLTLASWMFEAIFDYDEAHYEDVPLNGAQPAAAQHRFAHASASVGRPWGIRPDAFSSYRAGFEVRTYRRCRRVLMFHHIPDLATGEKGYEGLVRSTDFEYADLDYQSPVTIDDELAHQGSTRFASFLRGVTQSGYVRDDTQPPVVHSGVSYASYLKKNLPPLEFEYSKAAVQDRIVELDEASLENLPVGLDGSMYQWIDLHGEGIPGIVTEQAGAWFYKRNVSPISERPVEFAALERVTLKPSTSLAGTAQFMDLAGDGQPDLVMLDGPLHGLYEHDEREGWESFRTFTSRLDRDMRDPNLKLVDVDGDGHADVLISEDDAFVWHASLGEAGFSAARRVAKALDDERGPRLVFADAEHSIYLADMCGDGLTDLVRIGNGEVCYWPNLGYGRFGPKVTIDNVPRFDNPDQFDQRRLRLADIDGSGTTDVIYLHRDGVRLYFNQSGNRLSDTRHLRQCPHVDDVSVVTTTDLRGNGTACLVWSSPLPAGARRPIRYIDLMGGTKPHLLISWINNLGAETHVDYAHSTRFYLEDKRRGHPWVSRLPFPVHVVERVVTVDVVSGNRFVSRYAYHHGDFDGVEREFRGFGMVEQWDTEEFAVLNAGVTPAGTNVEASSHVPPIHTKTWFHTGLYLGRGRVSDYFAGLLDAADQGEYYRKPGLTDAQARAFLLDDTVLPAGLTVEEEREACRALKGSMLRQEVYALDDTVRQPHPYVVTEQNFTVYAVQPRGVNRHAVFFTLTRESINYQYERQPTAPRIGHTLTLETDEFGNVLQSAAIAYGRRVPDPTLSPTDQDTQARTLITYTQNRVTNAVETADDHRTPLLCESRTDELTGFTLPAFTQRFTFDDVLDAVAAATTIEYEKAPTAGVLQKRTIERVRTYYRRDDLVGALPLGVLQSLGLPFDSYRLAFTPGLVGVVYAGRANDPMFETDGRYVHNEGDANWWMPSVQIFYSADPTHTPLQELAHARDHFFLPHRVRDPFHTSAISTDSFVTYDRYDLLVEETRDAVGNRVTVGERHANPALPLVRRAQDYRVLQPTEVMDPNRNRMQVVLDSLGLVAGTAVRGKPEDVPVPGDRLTPTFRADLTQATVDQFLANPKGPIAATLLDSATTRIVYDVTAHWREPDPKKKPAVVAATLARETHASEAAPAIGLRIQVSLTYSDGFGREIQKKIQAEPGPVPMRSASGEILLDADGQPQLTAGKVSPRWVGSGWTVFDNKGNPVRRYEPFFTDTHSFEHDVRIGVSPVLFYDPVGRLVAILHPDKTWEKVVFDAWRQETSDASDTVGILDPRKDADVGSFFSRLVSTADFLPSWYSIRADTAYAAAAILRWPDSDTRNGEARAAEQALVHAGTPARIYFDSLGRPFLTAAHNAFKYSNTPPAAPRLEEIHHTSAVFDIEGNQRASIDAKVRIVMRYDYDMCGNRIHQASMEAGDRWALNDVVGRPMYLWDSRDQRFRSKYDALGRPTETLLRERGGAEQATQRTIYGEGAPNAEANNLRTRVFQVFDQAGVVTTENYDFKGNVKRSRRQIAQAHRTTINWSGIVALDAPVYISRTRYDALNRPVQIVAPHSNQPGETYNTIQPAYNEANLLEQVNAWLNQGVEPLGMLASATADFHVVTNIDYDAKGRRSSIEFGNGATTMYEYDTLTLRLSSLVTRRPSGIVQDLHYTYDPVGNVTRIRDDAQPSVFFNNQRVGSTADYTYDALSRLIEATGREHLGQVGSTPLPTSYNDAPRAGIVFATSDGNALGRYLERYVYDVVGNFLTMQHVGTDPAHPGWTREYTYAESSLLEGGVHSNRLTSTFTDPARPEKYSIGGDGYDPHGNMQRMPHLQELQWDFKDQLRMTRRQKVNTGDAEGGQHSGEKTWYVYDAGGQRVRKVTEFASGLVKEERLYLGGFEIYRTFGVNPIVRETVHIMDDRQRLALVERRTSGVEPGVPQQLIRYQLSNHLGSTSLELDDQARIISYEEYTPFGSTSHQGIHSEAETLKRYRFTGKERDQESGLYYHGTRYYAPWLGRWASCDPSGINDGPNLYRYVHCNPVIYRDPTGREEDKGFFAGLGHRLWQRATAPSEAAKAFKEGRTGDFVKHVAIDAALAINPAVSMTVGDVMLVKSTIELPGQIKDAATLPRGDEGGAKMADALVTYVELANRIAGPKAKGVLRKPAGATVTSEPTTSSQKVGTPNPETAPGTPSPSTPEIGPPKPPPQPEPSVATGSAVGEKPPLLVQVEIKPVGGEGGGWSQLEQPTRSSYGAIGIITEGGGYEGVATYDRVTGKVELKVSPIGEGRASAKTYQIGQLTPEQLAELHAKSGGDTGKFGNLVEAPIRAMISDATGQQVLDPGKNPSKTGVDWRPQQPPLPYVN